MRILWNTISLYLSLFGSFVLGLIQLKILSVHLGPSRLGEFFTVVAFSGVLAGIILLGIPLMLIRYLPKFHAEQNRNKMSTLLVLLGLTYALLSLVVYMLLRLFGYRLCLTVYKNEVISRYISFGFIVFSVIEGFSIIFASFNGIRKMHLSAGLNLLYLLCLTCLLFIFRTQLSIALILWLHLISVLPSIVIGALLLYREVGPPRFNLSLCQEILPYWKYAMALGVLSPFFVHLDRLLIGYFLSMPLVAVFTVAAKIKGWLAKILDIPIEAVVPEISHSWEKGRKEVLGEDLRIIIKLLFLLGLMVTIPVLVCGKEVIEIVSSREYIGGYGTLWFLCSSLVISCIYVPLPAAMRAVGKIYLYLISDVLWIFSYLIFTLILIKRFDVRGVGVAHLLATLLTLIFNLAYVAARHTTMNIERSFFYKVGVFGLSIGALTYFVSKSAVGPDWVKFVVSTLFVVAGYLLFLFHAHAFSEPEKASISQLIGTNFLQRILKI